LYLKYLEIVGFKSFAERTKLEFERGMTAIVGPNGCGKSNVSDAIRWVLGEQSARALRGAKMEDCIFNGTDSHKPLAMAEVSLTLSDCEKILGTDFNEVTVTRRVFRSGEGQYFINKAPCRLKDLQRLFMDTGVGTNSYSLMEQGRIDLILSSRPEDRREVFEEASGITKFKADKKEAIRKLEHTEANLLRLGDIIREVKRQIISLQRQVGKARRYKTLQEQLRRLDIFLGRDKLETLNREIGALETQLTAIAEQDEAIKQDVAQAEQRAAEIREEFSQAEEEISAAMEETGQARNDLDRTQELIRVNRDRIGELDSLSQRDTRETEEAQSNLARHRASLEELNALLQKATEARDLAEKQLAESTAHLSGHEKETETVRRLLHELRTESVELENRSAKLQNELYALEAKERTDVIRRERLAAEKAETQKAVEIHAEKLLVMNRQAEERRARVSLQEKMVKDLISQKSQKAAMISEFRQKIADLRTRSATRQGQIELLNRSQAEAEGFPGGARMLLDADNPLGIDRSFLLGSLAEQIQVPPNYRVALEASLRAWLDAIIVSDFKAAVEWVTLLQKKADGSARLLCMMTPANELQPRFEGAGVSLLDQVKCPDAVRPLIERLLWNVRIVDRMEDLPPQVPAEAVFVTPSGALIRGSGSFEYLKPGEQANNPLARQQTINEWRSELENLQTELREMEARHAALISDERTHEEQLDEARIRLEEVQRELALGDGEKQMVTQQAKQAQERAETVMWELDAIQKQTDSGGNRRSQIQHDLETLRTRQSDIRSTLGAKTEELHVMEEKRTEMMSAVTEHRVSYAEHRQHAEHLLSRKEPTAARIRELDALIRERAEGVNSYKVRIRDLEQATREAEARIKPLQEKMFLCAERLDRARRHREEKTAALAVCDAALRTKRSTMDEMHRRKSQMDVELAEQRMRRQNLVDRITADYHIQADQIGQEPEPEWENGVKPERDALETEVAEIHAKLESIGPVNLVAIEEHQELEERFAFLTQQQDDLVNAKQQLLDLIRKINQTTTELFSNTFNQVNLNFQELFKKMFGGGSAKLVLIDEENVLDSGIEIIARPPGKKLQTVSLLSGGERTMTAVALLFSLYMVKPSAFCVLDELDAALDESNIGRFVKMLKEFQGKSQFIMITHNRQTIGAADVLYGVTMEQHGVSKIVSVKFSKHEKKTEEQPAEVKEEAPVVDQQEPTETPEPVVSPEET